MANNRHSEHDAALVEYLYVDQRRLDSYFEQVSSPVFHEKVPIWKVALGLTGPKAEGTQERFSRNATNSEKISEVIDYLKRKDLLQAKRTYRPETPKMAMQLFGIETCEAIPIWIPPKQDCSPAFRGLRLWLSGFSQSSDERGLLLYLLEDFPENDRIAYGVCSGMSVLSILLNDYQRIYGNTVVYQKSLKETVDFADFDLYSRMQNGVSLSLNPAELLAQLGAQVGIPRFIRCLYRVRDTFKDYYREYQEAIFAYPIFIADAREVRDQVIHDIESNAQQDAPADVDKPRR